MGETLLYNAAFRLVQVDEDLFHAGWTYFKQHRDKQYSLTDCISFIVMRWLRLQTALTFDHHFAQAGFSTAPQ